MLIYYLNEVLNKIIDAHDFELFIVGVLRYVLKVFGCILLRRDLCFTSIRRLILCFLSIILLIMGCGRFGLV